jgi:biopolymer transport protein ExbD
MISSGKSIGASNGNAPMSEINTTPLVDVMLVLLVIFIITAPLMTHAVRIDLPKASSQLLNEKPEVVSISIDSAGKIYWNDAPINVNDAKAKLAVASKQNPQPEVHIRADKDTRYQILAEIMANAQTAGITKLGFVSEPK